MAKKWDEEQEKYLIENYSKSSIEKLRNKFNKTNLSIYTRVHKLRKKGFKIKNKILLEKGWSVIRVTSPSHNLQSYPSMEERLDVLVGVITKILEYNNQIN